MNESNLKKKTVAELKTIANEKKLKFTAKAKKSDLIQLILTAEKVTETAQEIKKDFSQDSSSQSSSALSQPQPQPQYNTFSDAPPLPSHYGKNKMIFMVRDPFWGFVYWETNQAVMDEHQLYNQTKYLRVYDITGTNNPEQPHSHFDIKINNTANNWYINFPQPNRTYVIDLGYIKDGQFITVLRSNIASTPRDDVSDQIDEEWMMSDEYFNNILKASGADQLFQQIGSQELMKFLAGNVTEESLFSGNVSSPVKPLSSK
ncbi:MAG: DUF4912 domain-containing protein [Spirochaetes bacterium]|nr:DUF4912 domain-containing protein [Spirochaetota bacterium]